MSWRWKIWLLFIIEIWQETTGKLVHWDNPAASAGMLSGVLALLLSISYYSLVSVLAYISLGLLAAIMAIKVYSAVMVFMKKVREGTITVLLCFTVSMLVYYYFLSNLVCAIDFLWKEALILLRRLSVQILGIEYNPSWRPWIKITKSKNIPAKERERERSWYCVTLGHIKHHYQVL